jgi:hypothetical protein
METDFTNSLALNNKNYYYKELKVKHLKTLYKCLVGDDPDSNTIFLNFNQILQSLSNLSPKEIQNLDFIDYFFLVLEIRTTSIGGSVFIEIPELTNTKIELNLTTISNKITDIKKKYQNLNDRIDEFYIEYRLPTIHDLITINNQILSDELYFYFIKSISIKDFTVKFSELSSNDSIQILNQLPAKVTSKMYKNILTIFRDFNNINLLPNIKELNDRQLVFNFNINNLIVLLKIIFGDDLLSLYDNIFWLCKFTRFTPEYVENLTPGEYLLYVKKVQAITNADKNTNDTPLTEYSDGFEEM